MLFTRAPSLMKLAAALGRRHIRKSLRSPRLREIVTPRYVPGCKRILVSNDYYPALEQANVEVVTDALAAGHAHRGAARVRPPDRPRRAHPRHGVHRAVGAWQLDRARA